MSRPAVAAVCDENRAELLLNTGADHFYSLSVIKNNDFLVRN
jgi:hypothetical protein